MFQLKSIAVLALSIASLNAMPLMMPMSQFELEAGIREPVEIDISVSQLIRNGHKVAEIVEIDIQRPFAPLFDFLRALAGITGNNAHDSGCGEHSEQKHETRGEVPHFGVQHNNYMD